MEFFTNFDIREATKHIAGNFGHRVSANFFTGSRHANDPGRHAMVRQRQPK
jgi:hypothetical protein